MCLFLVVIFMSCSPFYSCQVLSDPDLREMLMDPQLQTILQECGDPMKFQQHMRNPVTAAKIKKLYAAGLVGTAQ